MKTFIFIAGAPGSGKSSVAAALQHKLGTPLFEFGWIPEFRNTGSRIITYKEDESLAFENLTLVLKNYAKHGFKNILITDLENKRIAQLKDVFDGFDFVIATLRLPDEEQLKKRVLKESRTSEYRNWKESLSINQHLLARNEFPHEHFIDVRNESIDDIAQSIIRLIDK